VMSVCSCRATIAAFPVPEGKHVGVDLLRSHPGLPTKRVRTLRYCQADRKRRRGDPASVEFARKTHLPVADTRCLLRVKMRRTQRKQI
jgi:hypothetical protein